MTFTYDENSYSDLHKDALGFRPIESSWIRWCAMSQEEKQTEWDSLCGILDRVMKDEKAAEIVAVAEFESRLFQLIGLGAKDRETAIKWVFDAEEAYDYDHLCFALGLPCNYLK